MINLIFRSLAWATLFAVAISLPFHNAPLGSFLLCVFWPIAAIVIHLRTRH